jgi:hypothetical protein
MASPYLRDDQRLGDVIAAIQAMGTYKFYKLDFAAWADRITGDAAQANHWRQVFEEHPEFFRLGSARQKASLILRRQRQRLYNVDDETVWTKSKYDGLSGQQKTRFSRNPLSANEIEALVDVAINLHTRATERARDRRVWLTSGLAFAGALAGGVVTKLVAG